MSNQQQRQQQRYDDDDDETDDYGFDRNRNGSHIQMTSQQQRQHERRLHAEMGTAAEGATDVYGKSVKNKKSRKCKVIGWSTLVLVLLAVAGVLAWYFAVHKKNEGNNNKKNGGGSGSGSGEVATGPT
ncbi:hypothetical protein BGZ94_001679, partial [Podila epigama]